MSQKTYKTIFFGTPDFALPVLDALVSLPFVELMAVVTQPDKPVGRSQALTPPPVKSWAIKHEIPVWQPTTLKQKSFIEQFQETAPDVCIVVAYGKIIPATLLVQAPRGWLNVHASLLPAYRGASPIQAAILHGETETGVTLMQLDAGLDTGPIITQEKTPITPDENFASLHDKLGQLGATLIAQSLLPYLNGDVKPTPQDNSKATLTTTIAKTDGRIDWKKSSTEIDRQIRAYTPWPGAYCFWTPRKTTSAELRLKILSAVPAETAHRVLPGQTAANEGVIVGCGHGSLELKKVQLEGKTPLDIKDFIRGYPEFTQTILS